ncbi:MAG: hypothetical protein DME50_05270 [Verrucomicrobia bacterium]|nr:MAG: hypothetical protein DME50_05270 [Verrucomicrobiota bacterium]
MCGAWASRNDLIGSAIPIEILARLAVGMGSPITRIAAFQKYSRDRPRCTGVLVANVPLTPAPLRLDPMFDPLRGDPRFQKLVASPAPK